SLGVYTTVALVGSTCVIGPSVPAVGPMTIEKARAPPSTSAPLSVIVTGVSSSVVTATGSTTGGSSTGVTVMLTVAGAESLVPSLTRNVKLSAPAVFGSGV